MTVYTRRLGTLEVTQAAIWLEICRHPGSGTVVMRDLLVTNATTASVTEVAIRVRPVAKVGGTWVWYQKPLAIGTTHLELRQVLEVGESAEIFSAAVGVHVFLTGYVFSSG